MRVLRMRTQDLDLELQVSLAARARVHFSIYYDRELNIYIITHLQLTRGHDECVYACMD